MPGSPGPAAIPAVLERLRSAGCVFAEEEARLLVSAARSPAELDLLVERRAAGLPLEQLLGWAEFFGIRITVEPDVFVPRRRTELLVREALASARAEGTRSSTPIVLDLCCGSGAVGAALAASLPAIELHAADIEPAAVRCARRNIQPFDGTVYEGDLFDPLPADLRGRIQILVVNAPYVPTTAIALMPPEARLHEPRVALDGGADGLDLQRRIAAEAPLWLAPEGELLIETSERQAAQTVEILERSGLVTRVASSDELGATVVAGRRRGNAS